MGGLRPLFLDAERRRQPGKRVEVWFQDEARVGQQGTLTHVWAETGSRPERVRQTEYEWVYLFGAVNPLTGASSAMLAPTANAAYMTAHLRMVGEAAGPDAHVVLVLDGAGWHKAKELVVPANVTLLCLPPYSPKLNPVERVWKFLREHYLSNRVYKDYDDVFDATAAAWNRLDAARFKSLCAERWVTLAS